MLTGNNKLIVTIITRAFVIWTNINYGVKCINLAISLRGFPSCTSSTSENVGSRRGYLTRCSITGFTNKNTIISTSMFSTSTGFRWSTVFKIGHVGTELAFSFTYCTGVFHSG